MEEAYERFQEGSRLLAASDTHAAVIALERARDLEPEQGSIRETLARAYFRTGRFELAEAEFEKSLELDPVNDYALFGLGMCRLRAGDAAGARRHLKLATIMRPEAEAYREALARADSA
jgi:Flp pilus assembly protein TadD